MGIRDSDLQFMESEKLTDFSDGGGRITGRVIEDGVTNNLFDDVPELHRVMGHVSLRKCCAAVRNLGTDAYLGSNVIISGQPTDPNTSVTLFTTRSPADTRDAAKNYLENYLDRGGRYQGWLYGKHAYGSRVVTIWQRVEIDLPAIDSVLCLVEGVDAVAEYSQYIKIRRLLDNKIQTFSDDQGDFTRRVIRLEITAPLGAEFHGVDVMRFDSAANAGSKCMILQTVVANAVDYYGSSKLTRSVQRGQRLIRVASIFNQLVPATRAETPIADVNAAGDSLALVPSGNGVVSFSYSANLSPIVPLYLKRSCVPGSLHIVGAGYELIDRGGELIAGNVSVGTVDYGRGEVIVTPGGATYSGGKQVSFQPAGSPTRVMDTASIHVSLETRGSVYIFNLNTPLAPGSISISYLAQGKWYELIDNGSGAAYGSDPAFGSANINYTTQTVIATLGALPDVDSEVIVTWAGTVNYYNRANFQPSAPAFEGTLGVPTNGPVRFAWTDGTNELSAQSDNAGDFSGDASGRINPLTGDFRLAPNKTPLLGTEFRLTGNAGLSTDMQEISANDPARLPNGSVRVVLVPGIQPGAILTFNLAMPPTNSDSMKQYVGSPGTVSALMLADGTFSGGVNGQYNSATGELTLYPDYQLSIPVERYKKGASGNAYATSSSSQIGGGSKQVWDGWGYETVTCSLPQDGSGYVSVRYVTSTSPTSFDTQLTMTELVFDLTDRFAEQISVNSVQFAYAGRTYIDNGGRLVTDVSPTTGAGRAAGEINYASGRCVLRLWADGHPNQIALQSMLTEIGGQPVSEVTFRIPIAPVRPGSISMTAVSLTGGQVRVDPDGDSEFVIVTARGRIDYATGVVYVQFGKMVTAAGYESEVWFDPDQVTPDGKIWMPLPVLADTIRYSAVGYTYLPLDAEVLGLDPVRLPTDGRVPVFADGRMIVLQHDGRYPLPAVVTAGTVYNVGRTRLSRVRVIDDNGNVLPTERYDADMDAGTVVFKSPIDLSGTDGLLTIVHRIEDASIAYDVQINGDISLQRPLSHDYPDGSIVSSALIGNTLQARVTNIYTQKNWMSRWLDYAEGELIAAQYNSTQYPIVVDNQSCITERWAIIFTDTQKFRLIGEYSGQIATGSINEDFAPINPNTSQPYFTIKAAGWGGGWQQGNVLRDNTIGAYLPLWLARTTLMGDGSMDGDLVQLQLRGDVNKSDA